MSCVCCQTVGVRYLELETWWWKLAGIYQKFLFCYVIVSPPLWCKSTFLPVTCCVCQGPPLRLPMPLSKSERKRSESMEAQMGWPWNHGTIRPMETDGFCMAFERQRLLRFQTTALVPTLRVSCPKEQSGFWRAKVVRSTMWYQMDPRRKHFPPWCRHDEMIRFECWL